MVTSEAPREFLLSCPGFLEKLFYMNRIRGTGRLFPGSQEIATASTTESLVGIK